jgi:hypothetical protein
MLSVSVRRVEPRARVNFSCLQARHALAARRPFERVSLFLIIIQDHPAVKRCRLRLSLSLDLAVLDRPSSAAGFICASAALQGWSEPGRQFGRGPQGGRKPIVLEVITRFDTAKRLALAISRVEV